MKVQKYPDYVNSTSFINTFGKFYITSPFEFSNFLFNNTDIEKVLSPIDIEFVSLNERVGYFRTVNHRTLKLSISGNGFEGDVTSDTLGLISTLFILSDYMFEAYHRNMNFSALVESSDLLKLEVSNRDDRYSIYRAID